MLMKEVQSYGKFPKRHELFVQTKKGKMSECWREEQCGTGYNKRRISNEI